jgi:hypothetical protein
LAKQLQWMFGAKVEVIESGVDMNIAGRQQSAAKSFKHWRAGGGGTNAFQNRQRITFSSR